MVFSRKRNHDEAYPPVPDSLRSDSVELAELRKTQLARADTAPYITPYLGLRARLSQIWINRWTVLLLLVLLRVLLLLANLNEGIDDAKIKALSACTKVEDIGSAMASMPHYLSVGVNELSAQGIEKAVSGLVTVLGMVITGVQELIIFVINMLTSMYTCLITLAIHGSLDVAAEVTTKVTDGMNKIIGDISNGIEGDIKGFQDSFNGFIDKIEQSIIGSLVPDVPKLDIAGRINDMRNIKIDASGFVSDINKLNDALPTFEEVQKGTRDAISIPFNLVKKELDENFKGYKFDRSVFPVAQKQALSFCSDNTIIKDFFDNLKDLAAKARIIFIVILSVLAVLVIVPMAWLEIKRWRRQVKHAKLIEQNQYDSMDAVYIASRPLTATWGIKLSSRFKGKRQVLVRWCVAYATSLPAIFVLSLALAGFVSCLCQLILLSVIEKQVPGLASQVGNFANEVVDTLEDVSVQWAVEANGVVTSMNDKINEDLFGHVTKATSSVNDTLNTFTDMMDTALEAAFKDTILINPIRDVIRCTIGLKVESVQKGLTWVHDNAHVTFPRFDNDTFSLGAAESISGDSDLTTFLASPSTVTTDEVTGAVTRVTDALRRGLVTEALISTGLLLVYVIIVLIGVVRALVGMAVPDRTRGEGGMRYTGDDRPPLSPRSPQQQTEDAGSTGRFPRFGGSEPSAVVEDDHYGREVRDEKLVSKVAGGRAKPVDGHIRKSSYGRFESDNKF